MAKTLPERSEIKEKLASLRSGISSREDISKWAMQFIDDDIRIDDPGAWEVIKSMGGADLHGIDRAYLYGKDDFEDWESKLQ